LFRQDRLYFRLHTQAGVIVGLGRRRDTKRACESAAIAWRMLRRMRHRFTAD